MGLEGKSKRSDQIILSSSSSEGLPSHPFLNWAGGKRWLIHNYPELLPKHINGLYLEPFLGSGSVFFHLQPKAAILSDKNRELIDAYRGVRSRRLSLYEVLEEHSQKHSNEYYYKVRAQQPSNLAERAARFIYLNRTCFNGIYRVNSAGQFNVPLGSKNNVLLPRDDFRGWSSSLKGVDLKNVDFENIVNLAAEGDFLFVDPPYTVRHNFNGFIQYNEVLFTWEDQVRLAKALHKANERGVSILMTNANHESIKALYPTGFKQKVVSRFSSISATIEGRSAFEELVITTY